MSHEQHRMHGQIRPSAPSLPADVLSGFARHETAKACDAMGGYGAMHHAIKPLSPEMRVIGTAVTILTKPGDALYVQAAVDLTRPGDVIVIDAGGFEDVSVIGERLVSFYKLKGAAGIVVDGAVRDAQGIVDQGPPTFARSNCIRIFGSAGPGAINVPIQCGGVTVHPGDVILGDRDGVVVVPRDDAARVLALTDEHLQGELSRASRIEAGESMDAVFGLEAKLAKWRT